MKTFLKRFLITIICIAVLFVGALFFRPTAPYAVALLKAMYGEPLYIGLHPSIRKIKVGQSKKEVQEILGEPFDTIIYSDESRAKYWPNRYVEWRYSFLGYEPEASVIFDKDDKVTEITFGYL